MAKLTERNNENVYVNVWEYRYVTHMFIICIGMYVLLTLRTVCVTLMAITDYFNY